MWSSPGCPRGNRCGPAVPGVPSAGVPLSWYDNIPLCSYVWLRGRCRSCGAAIPWRYPLVELAGGLMALALWHTFPDKLLLLAYAPFGLALIALTAIDLEHRLLPDAITIPGIILGLLLSLVLPQLSFSGSRGRGPGGRGVILWGWPGSMRNGPDGAAWEEAT